MRRAVLPIAAAVVLVGPTALAFFSGGYFDRARLIATLAAWTVVLALAFASPRPLPTSWPGRVALAGLVLICAWTGLSLLWAPLSSTATDSLVRLLLYVGALLAAIAVLRDHGVARSVEPAIAAGAVVVIGYGLSGRLLPGIIELSRSFRAGGRLEQPITYWNAEGALAAIGLVLCARLAGDRSRPTWIRVAAAAASAPLGLGLYQSFSRGAIAAAFIGLVVLLAAAPSWPQLRAIGIALLAGFSTAACSAVFSEIASVEGSLAGRERDGAIMLVILVAVALAAGLAQSWAVTAEQVGRVRANRLGVAGRLPAVGVAAAALGFAGLIVGGLAERNPADELSDRAAPARLTSAKSHRYYYWRVGLEAFGRDPLKGVGAGGFRVAWLRERSINAAALDVHSLPLEMAGELGIPGLLGLGLLLGGTGVAARRALRRRPALVAGSCAAGLVWLLHATIDWDWEVPAVTLPALVMAAALIVASEESATDPRTDQGA